MMAGGHARYVRYIAVAIFVRSPPFLLPAVFPPLSLLYPFAAGAAMNAGN